MNLLGLIHNIPINISQDDTIEMTKRSKLSRSNSENFSRRPSMSRARREEVLHDDFANLSIAKEIDSNEARRDQQNREMYVNLEEETPLMDHLKVAGSTLAGSLIYNQVMSYDCGNDRHHLLNSDMPNYFAGPDPMHTVVGAAVGNALYNVITEPSESLDSVKDCFRLACKAATTCLPYSHSIDDGQDCCDIDGATLRESPRCATLKRTTSSRAIKEAARLERMTRTRLKKSRSRRYSGDSEVEE